MPQSAVAGTREVANVYLMTFLLRIHEILGAPCRYIPPVPTLFDVFVAVFPSLFLYPRGVPRQTPINRTRYKGLVSTIFARAFVFIQLIVCQVFQSVATGLAYRAFVILSRFPLKCTAIHFYASDNTTVSAIRNSLLTHRNFFNHAGNVNYLITNGWRR